MPNFDAFRSLIAIAIASGTLLTGCATASAGDKPQDTMAVNAEGLATVRSKSFDTALVRPGTDFGKYSQITLHAPELAYRPADRSAKEFPLNAEQKAQFRDALAAAFEKEFTGLTSLALTDAPGADTLALHVRVQDIVVRVAPRSVGRGGRSGALLEASSDAVIVVELRDSQTNTVLARGVDAATARGAAVRSDDEVKTRFEATGKIVDDWARIARNGVEALLAHGN